MKQKLEISFGCQVTAEYKACYIIDSGNCFKVCPDGRLSLKNNILGFGKVYSLRRLHTNYVEELRKDLISWHHNLEKSENISQTAKSIALFLSQQILVNIVIYLLKQIALILQSEIMAREIEIDLDEASITNKLSKLIKGKGFLKEENPISALCLEIVKLKNVYEASDSNILGLKKVSDAITLVMHEKNQELLDNIHLTLNDALLELLEYESAQKIQLNMMVKFKDEMDLITKLIKNPKEIAAFISIILATEIRLSLTKNNYQTKNFIANLQLEIVPNMEFTANEKIILETLEQKLTPKEMSRLESRKTALIALSNLKGLPGVSETRALYLPARNSIFVKQNNIHRSLVHEVQHSLGKDIHATSPMRFFKFYTHCKTLRMTSKGIYFALDDELIVLDHETRAKTEPDNQPLQYRIRRAKYLVSLYNYSPLERDGEILAHLRQFIADFGEEHTTEMLPKLYQYWVNEVLYKYSALPQ